MTGSARVVDVRVGRAVTVGHVFRWPVRIQRETRHLEDGRVETRWCWWVGRGGWVAIGYCHGSREDAMRKAFEAAERQHRVWLRVHGFDVGDAAAATVKQGLV